MCKPNVHLAVNMQRHYNLKWLVFLVDDFLLWLVDDSFAAFAADCTLWHCRNVV